MNTEARVPHQCVIIPTYYLAVATSDGYWQRGANLGEVLSKLRKQLGKQRAWSAPIMVWASDTDDIEAEFDIYVRVRVPPGHPLVQFDCGGIK